MRNHLRFNILDKKMKRFSLFAFLLPLAGCGSVMHGPMQELHFDSNVNDVQISGLPVACTTPCSVWIKRSNNPLYLTARKQGYKTVQGTITVSFSPFFMFGTTTGGVYSTTTDYLSGSIYRYDADRYFFDMVPENGYEESDDDKIRRFILTNYFELEKELAQRQAGEYLRELSQLAQIPADDLIKMDECRSAADYADAVLKRYNDVAPAMDENGRRAHYPDWVALYEKEGYIGQTDRSSITYIGYGEGATLQAAKKAAVQDIYNKASAPVTGRLDGSVKVSLKGLRLFSEFKYKSGNTFKMWLMYRYPKSQLESDRKEYGNNRP